MCKDISKLMCKNIFPKRYVCQRCLALLPFFIYFDTNYCWKLIFSHLLANVPLRLNVSKRIPLKSGGLTDWLRVQDQLMGIQKPAQLHCDGGHGKANTVKGHGRSTFGRKLKARLILGCAILLPDYVCFGYDISWLVKDFPSTCVRAGFFKEGWESTLQELQDSFCPYMGRLPSS